MPDSRRKDRGIVINSSFLLSIIILLVSGYSTYVITNLSSKIDKNFDLVQECQNKIIDVKETVSSHLSWHDGIKEIRNKFNLDSSKKSNRKRR